ncbi:MAG: SSU ribosomal protein S5p (S2e), partial [uncultured Friedmanniella sp.]
PTRSTWCTPRWPRCRASRCRSRSRSAAGSPSRTSPRPRCSVRTGRWRSH